MSGSLGITLAAGLLVAELFLAALVALRLFKEREAGRPWPKWALAGGLGGSILAVIGFFFAQSFVENDIKIQFERQAQSVLGAVQQEWGAAEQSTLLLARLLEIPASSSSNRFQRLAPHAIAGHPGIENVTLVARIPENARKAWESQNGPIWNCQGDRRTPAPPAAEYWVTTQLFPKAEDARLGCLLLNQPALARGGLPELKSGQVFVSRAFSPSPSGRWVLGLASPVVSGTDRRTDEPAEMVWLTLGVQELFQTALERQPEAINLAVQGPVFPTGTHTEIFRSRPRSNGSTPLLFQSVLTLGPQKFTLVFTPAGEASILPVFPWLVLGFGLAGAILAGKLLHDAERRHHHFHRLAEHRDRQLHATERSFSSIVEAIPEAVILITPAQGKILEVNPFAANWLGRSQEQMRGMSLAEILAPPLADRPEEVLQRLAAGGRTGLVQFCDPNGGKIEAELTGASIVFHGRPVFVLMARDVSVIEQARRAAEAASQAKNHFLANISHEIRTPLNGILGMTELIQDIPIPEPAGGMLVAINRCARDLMLIVEDVLDFSRLEDGQLELAAVAFDLRELVSETTQRQATRARAKKLLLVDSCRRDLPGPLIGDAGRLSKVLFQMIGNSIKFTETGEIEVRAFPSGPPENGVLPVVITVRDTGCGIPRELHESIFEPFRQVDGSFTRRHGGTGLGLAFCRQVIRAMGGSIEVESSPGVGSTFALTVPLRLEEKGALLPPVENLLGRPVLVVSQSPAVQSGLAELLLTLGLRARMVTSLVAGVATAESARTEGAPIEAVLADLDLVDDPAQHELVGALVRHTLPTAPLIAVASQPVPQAPEKARAVLALPAELKHLNRLLSELMDPPPPSAPAVDDPSATPVILVVEDNRLNRHLLVTMLRRSGYQVISAENGQEALEILDRKAVDLAVMDVQMPVLDGLSTTLKIRKHKTHKDLPVIALTAHALAGDREACLSAGMNDYLSKPVQRNELLQLIERLIQERRRNATAAPSGEKIPS